MFLTAALSGPAAEAGRIPFNGTIAANESYQLFGNPPIGFLGGVKPFTGLERQTLAGLRRNPVGNVVVVNGWGTN